MSTALKGRTIVVTGATAGIGLATAEALVKQGAQVIGVGRSEARCSAAVQRLRSVNPEALITYFIADFARQEEVRSLAVRIKELLAKSGRPALDGLVNNAGTFTYWLALTPEGLETQWEVNHLAPFLLTWELLPSLEQAPDARVVTVSSGSHYHTELNWDDIQLRRRYNGLQAYKQTKLANVLFTMELNRRLGPGSTVRAFAADPGLVRTDIGLKGTPALVQWVWQRRRSAGVSAAEAARGILYLLTEPAVRASTQSYWRQGKPLSPSRQALSASDARRLWSISAQMCALAER